MRGRWGRNRAEGERESARKEEDLFRLVKFTNFRVFLPGSKQVLGRLTRFPFLKTFLSIHKVNELIPTEELQFTIPIFWGIQNETLWNAMVGLESFEILITERTLTIGLEHILHTACEKDFRKGNCVILKLHGTELFIATSSCL